jgi:hypothetical protein
MELLLLHDEPVATKLVKKLSCLWNPKGHYCVKASVVGVCEGGKCIRLPQDMVGVPGHADTAVQAGQYRTRRVMSMCEEGPCFVKLSRRPQNLAFI